jgi:predicted N-acetyltransferase YhbS
MATAVVAATGPLLERILNDTHPVWGEGLDREAYGKYNEAQLRTAWGSRHLQRLAFVDDGELLSTAKRYDLEAVVDGQRVRMIGLGAVFTPLAMRGRGYAAELLRLMLQSAADEGFGLALLFSEIDPRYYEHLGFRRVPVNQVSLAVRPGRRPGPPMISMRSGDYGDLASIVDMNASQRDGFRFSLHRDREYAQHAITKKRLLAACGRPGHRHVEFFVIEEGGRAAAYVVLLEVGEHLMITECGDRDPSGARVGAMLQAIVARDPSKVVRLRAWLPVGFLPPQLEITAHEVAPVTMMLRPLGRTVWPAPGLQVDDIAWWHADAF